MPEITIGSLKAHLAVPAVGDGPWPGVVVLHESFGLTDDIRQQAGRFAAAGYLAVAPDLYSAGGYWRCMRATFRSLSAGRGEAFDDIDAARRWLGARPDCTDRVGVIGFCMGGGFVLTLAAQQGDRIAAAVPFYGSLREATDFTGMDAEVLGHYGESDQTIPAEEARALAERIHTESGRPAEFLFYPAGHAFFNDENLIGTYDEESARTAWVRTLEFLRTRLG